ncbi:hypothetical protein [Anabaena catenula]|uniref:Uncharacterized protein n=1 Tax=Anabaena catenula FACHB-362 TaxID=2692877 RepID=A0ABR8JBY1_9NOST|nr:hypothetical protein [Anabaena catenula]MBD2694953.1 hypothetical protein [Anabaena catenula FACHB-362]
MFHPQHRPIRKSLLTPSYEHSHIIQTVFRVLLQSFLYLFASKYYQLRSPNFVIQARADK